MTRTGDTTATYQAPAGATGSARVIARAVRNGLTIAADTSRVSFVAPGSRPTPFGAFAAWSAGNPQPNLAGFTLYGPSADFPELVAHRLNTARAGGDQVILTLTGGGHDRYLTNGVFDLAKWRAELQRYNTATIRLAIAQACSDGTLLGVLPIDEPHHHSWGGWFTKARLDQLATEVKAIFPCARVGFTIRPDWHPDERFTVVDFVVPQFWIPQFGPEPRDFRDMAAAQADRDGVSPLFSINLLDGGVQASRRDANGNLKTTWAAGDCPLSTTGGRGTFFPNCRMTPAQVVEAGTVLGSAGCALIMWRYDAGMFADPAYQAAFRTVYDVIKDRNPSPCIRMAA